MNSMIFTQVDDFGLRRQLDFIGTGPYFFAENIIIDYLVSDQIYIWHGVVF